MEFFQILATACSSVTRHEAKNAAEETSDIQLNAFEFRNYRTSLEPAQQKLLERIVNQWCSMLAKGKTLRVNNYEEKVSIDRELLALEFPQHSREFYPLKAIRKLEMFKDDDDMSMNHAWGLDVTFEGTVGDISLVFNFEQERHRLHFALTLRVLRTRDPLLDPSQEIEVIGKEGYDDDEDEGPKTIGRIIATEHYSADKGIPMVFSVSDMKIYQPLQSTSRYVYLEFFVRYPRQDRFLYAKSPTAQIEPQALMAADTGLKRRRDTKDDDDDDAAKEKARDQASKDQVTGKESILSGMRFDLKNVKLKLPKIPHTIFGRMMAKDDYFPTAVGTFDFEVKRSYLQDRRSNRDQSRGGSQKGAAKDEAIRTDPETLTIPVMSSWKVKVHGKDEHIKVGALTLRLLVYVVDAEKAKATGHARDQQSRSRRRNEDEEVDGEDEEEDGDEDNQEDTNQEGDNEDEEEEEEDDDEEGQDSNDEESEEEGKG